MAQTQNSIKLTRRGRSLLRVVAAGSLLVVIGAGFSATGHASETRSHSTSSVSSLAPSAQSAPSAPSGYIRVVVAPGESLWSVAAMVAGNRDVSSVLDEIVTANNLPSTDVATGTRLLVPLK